MQTVAQFADAVAKYPAQLERDRKRAANKAALAITRELRQRIRADAGGDSRLSGVGVKGARVGANYRQLPSGDVRVQATGPVHLLESPTAPHEITPRRRGRKALRLSDGQIVARVQHPGTRGKRTWTRGVREGTPKGEKAFTDEIAAGFRRALTS